MKRIIGCCFFSLFLVLFGTVEAAKFRIDNEVQPEGVKSTTYLIDGDFYSMIGQNGEITFYDSKTKTFSIFDPALRIQTRIDAMETQGRIEQILDSSKLDPGTFNAFVVKPTFQTEFDAPSGAMALRSPWFDYVMETTAFPGDEMEKQYFDFCDRSCYLNFRLSHSKSMLVRLEINKILASQRRFPTKMSVAIYPKGKGPLAKAEKAESVHRIVIRLTEADEQRIASAKEAMRTFPAVPFTEYEQKVAEKQKSGK